MNQNLSIGQRLALGFSTILLMSVLSGGMTFLLLAKSQAEANALRLDIQRMALVQKIERNIQDFISCAGKTPETEAKNNETVERAMTSATAIASTRNPATSDPFHTPSVPAHDQTPETLEVCSAWPRLSPVVKTGILAMVRSSGELGERPRF